MRRTSVGVEAMTRSTSAVAVCSRASSQVWRLLATVTFEEAGVLDSDDGLIGERLQQPICRSVNSCTSKRCIAITPMEAPSRNSGT
ncbi:MAG: hypothetical protein U0893_14005 [Chloroflexota bacterium]